jgi:two-component system response regulator YesN
MKKRISFSTLYAKSKSYFFRLFLYISISIVVLISVTSYAITSSNAERLLKTVNTANQKLLLGSTYNFDYLNNYILSLIQTLYVNNSTKILAYSKDQSDFSVSKAVDDLYNIIFNIPFVHSTYIYSGVRNNFYCVAAYPVVRSTETMYDREIVEIIKRHDAPIAKPIPRIIPFSAYETKRKVNVYTYVLYNYENFSGRTTDAIVINIDSKWLMGNIVSKGKGIDENSVVMIAGRDGTVYSHPDEKMFMSDISNSAYFKQILHSKSSSGYFVKKIEGVESVINYNRIDSSGLVFFSITNLKDAYVGINAALGAAILISFILLLVSIVIAYFISRKFYVPISNLRKNMYTMLGIDSDINKKIDEFSAMNNMFNQAAQKISDLEKFSHENIGVLKNQFLLKLLTTNLGSSDEAVLKAKNLQICINSDKPLVLIVFQQDKKNQKYEEVQNEIDKMDIQLVNIIVSSFEKGRLHVEVVYVSKDRYVVILNSDEDIILYDEFIDSLFFYTEIIQNDISAQLKKSFSVSISRIFRNLDTINKAYVEALELISYRFVEGSGCILLPEYLHNIRSENLVFPINQVTELIEALKTRKTEASYQIHCNLTNYISEFSLDNIKYGIAYLSMMVFDMMNTVENNSNIAFEIQHSQFSKKLNSMETMQEINIAFEELYSHIIDRLHQKKNPKTDVLINDIKAYVEAHFTDSNLSLGSIADKFGYSSAYLGKIFNLTVGNSLASFINDVRLEKASCLLKDTNHTIEEIITMVGWESKKYFFTIFKKRFGVTPNEYRFER